MNSKIKVSAKIAFLVVIISLFSGCWDVRELNSLSFLLGVGVDKSEEPGLVDVTAQIAVPSSIGGTAQFKGSDQEPFLNITQTDISVVNAISNLTHQISRILYGAHTQVLVVGEDQAKDGMQKCLDFFIRDHEQRLSVPLIIVKGKACDFLDIDPTIEKVPAVHIEKLLEVQISTSQSISIRILDFLNAQISGCSIAIAPMYKVVYEEKLEDPKEPKGTQKPKDTVKAEDTKKGHQIEEEEGPQNPKNPEEDEKTKKGKAMADGFAVFKNDKMIGKVDLSMSRGYIWAMDKIKNGFLKVAVTGGEAELEIISSKTKRSIKQKKDGKIIMKLDIVQNSNIAGKIGQARSIYPKALAELEKRAEQVVKNEIKMAFKYSKEINADFMGAGTLLAKDKPKLWKTLGKDWDEVYQNVELEINVVCNIKATGRLAKYPRTTG